MAGESKRWSLAWRIGLVTLAGVLITASLARIIQDFTQPGPGMIPGYAHSNTINAPSFQEFLIPPTAGTYAELGITVTGLNTSNSTVTAQISIELDDSLVRRLMIWDGSGYTFIDGENSSQWMGLPVTLQLVVCGPDGPVCTGASPVQIPLGDLLLPENTIAVREVDLFDDSNPNAYPQDQYSVFLDPQLSLPSSMVLNIPGESSSSLPLDLTLSGGTGLVDKSVVVRYGGEASFGYQIVISRLGLDQSLAYAMALTPALLVRQPHLES